MEKTQFLKNCRADSEKLAHSGDFRGIYRLIVFNEKFTEISNSFGPQWQKIE
jgi:hypothetical protein